MRFMLNKYILNMFIYFNWKTKPKKGLFIFCLFICICSVLNDIQSIYYKPSVARMRNT